LSIELNFIVPGEPVAQPRHRVRTIGKRSMLYLPSKHPVHGYKAAIRAAFVAVAGKWKTLLGPVQLSVYCRFEMPKSWSKKKRSGLVGDLHDSKPDGDNVLKAIKDALTDCGVWNDDAQVALAFISKRWSETPQTEIWIRECDPDA
jgi:Holliday junction resolvase RusA-like endonuclease